MWNWLSCYVSGRHDFGVKCASGSIFLRCINCGKQSNGWAVHNQPLLVPATVPAVRHQAPRVPHPMPFVSPDIAPQQRPA